MINTLKMGLCFAMVKVIGLLVLCCLFAVLTTIDAADCTVGNMEYDYARQRDKLVEMEADYGNNPVVLTQDESIVDGYLDYLKTQEFKSTRHNFLPAQPIENTLAHIKQSKVFEVLKKFPKGGNVHLHQNHILSKETMLDLIFDSELVNDLCVNTKKGVGEWALGFYHSPPVGWVKVTSDSKLYSKSNLLQKITFINAMSARARSRPTDSETRWLEMAPMFGKAGKSLVRYANYTRMHVRALFEAALAENTQYLEARLSLNSLYVLDDSQRGGHKDIDSPDNVGESWLKLVTEELAAFQRTHPEFIGYRDIVQTGRYKGTESVKRELGHAARLGKKFPDIVRGYDLVSQEDQGHSLLFFIDELLEASAGNNTFPFYFHTTETNWPDDIITSLFPDDPVGTLENVYEAVLLGSKRIGHGIGVIKQPYIMELLKQQAVAVEANPVSNQLLGYVPDMRSHPAATYIRAGIPVIINADDPGTMGYNELTVDWYQAFMAWGLNLRDLKLLAMNSLSYSTMTSAEKRTAFSKWNIAWHNYINYMKDQACRHNISTQVPKVHRLFPRQTKIGHNLTNIMVFGRDFQSAICNTIVCRFGSLQSKGQYVHTSLIKCPNPEFHGVPMTVGFSISMDSGATFIHTNLTFSFANDMCTGDRAPSMVAQVG